MIRLIVVLLSLVPCFIAGMGLTHVFIRGKEIPLWVLLGLISPLAFVIFGFGSLWEVPGLWRRYFPKLFSQIGFIPGSISTGLACGIFAYGYIAATGGFNF